MPSLTRVYHKEQKERRTVMQALLLLGWYRLNMTGGMRSDTLSAAKSA